MQDRARAVLCVLLVVVAVVGVAAQPYPSSAFCKNRCLTSDCWGRPQTHLKGPAFFGLQIETVPVQSWGVGAQLCYPPEACTACGDGGLSDDALKAVDGVYTTSSSQVDNVRMYFTRGAKSVTSIRIYWASDAIVQNYDLTMGTGTATQTFTQTIPSGNVKPGNLTELTVAPGPVNWIKLGAADKVRVAEFEAYEDASALQEPCPAVNQANEILGPVVAVVFNYENLVERFEEIRWDQITHIIFSALKVRGTSYVDLSPCHLSYLKSLVCWAHTRNVQVYIRVDGQSSDFATIVADPAKINSFASAVRSFAVTYDLDGIDLNWHYPESDTEGSQFEQLLGALYNDGAIPISAGLPLNSALFGTAPSRYIPNEAFKWAFWWHLNGWDYVQYPPRAIQDAPVDQGVYTDSNNQNPSPYDKVVDAATYWLARGIPAPRFVLGVPFFGVSYSIYTGGPQSYRSIMTRYAGFSPSNEEIGYIKYSSWQGTFNKVSYAMGNKFAGILADEYNQDELRGLWEKDYPELKKYGRLSLLDAINDALPYCGTEHTIAFAKTDSTWNPNSLNININDKVRWNWRNGATHNVAQSASSGGTTYLVGGFYSGIPLNGSADGNIERADSFTKVFNVPGTYYFFDEVTSATGTILVAANSGNSTCISTLPALNTSVPIGPSTIDPGSSSVARPISWLLEWVISLLN